jgi:predicted ATPase
MTLDMPGNYAHRITEMTLEPLSDEAAGELAEALAPTGTLDSGTRLDLVARSEGNPLYVEELLHMLADSGGLQRDHGGSLSFTRAALVLPPALEGLLVTRLQQLRPTARQVAQVAAVIGQEFPIDVLEHVMGSDITDEITVLLRAEIVREHRRHPTFECTFRHSLLREAALSTITPARAKELFGRVAAAFEERYAGSLEDHLEQLAFYYYESDQYANAIEYLTRAGARATSLQAPERAAMLFARARQLASRAGDTETERKLHRLSAESGTVPPDQEGGAS